MRGTEKIIAHIQADAKAQADAIIEAAAGQCAKINAEYEAKAAAAYEEAHRALAVEGEQRLDGAHRMNEMEAKKAALAMKQKQVGEAFDRAMKAIPELPEGEYEDFLVRLAADSIASGDEEVIFNQRDRERLGERTVAAINAAKGTRLTLSAQSRDFAGGLILKRGNIEVNATLELLMELARRELAPEVARILFG